MSSQAPAQPDTLALLKAGKLTGATYLRLSCNLTSFPPEIYALADTLEILDLSGNALTHLPDDFNRLRRLKILFCSSNQFNEFPQVLGQSKTLRMIGFKHNHIRTLAPEALPTHTLLWLILTDNQLHSLPESLGECVGMQKLMLAGNRLSTLPASLVQCQQLELLRISANQLTHLPDGLWALPKLAWLAYAGNPLPDAPARVHAVLPIAWDTLRLGAVLGQGASGLTYHATWQRQNGQTEAVAVKLFKGEVTSDGLPDHEIQANLLARQHPNLVGVNGVVMHHPQGLKGLVMPLLEADLQALANPPSYDSCTRDEYPDHLALTRAQAMHIASGVASALRHLHAQGLLHGDVYAHNILWNDRRVVLSDLGGASLLPTQDQALAKRLIALDHRAYQVLVEELARIAPLTPEDVHAMHLHLDD